MQQGIASNLFAKHLEANLNQIETILQTPERLPFPRIKLDGRFRDQHGVPRRGDLVVKLGQPMEAILLVEIQSEFDAEKFDAFLHHQQVLIRKYNVPVLPCPVCLSYEAQHALSAALDAWNERNQHEFILFA